MLVAEVADSSVVSQVYANRSEEEDLQQLHSMVGTIGQAENTQLGSLHTVAATSANSYAPTIRGLQAAEVANNSVVSQVYANCSEEGGLLQLPSIVDTSGQPKNTQLGSLHTVAATGENLVSQSARSWQVAKVADNNTV